MERRADQPAAVLVGVAVLAQNACGSQQRKNSSGSGTSARALRVAKEHLSRCRRVADKKKRSRSGEIAGEDGSVSISPSSELSDRVPPEEHVLNECGESDRRDFTGRGMFHTAVPHLSVPVHTILAPVPRDENPLLSCLPTDRHARRKNAGKQEKKLEDLFPW